MMNKHSWTADQIIAHLESVLQREHASKAAAQKMAIRACETLPQDAAQMIQHWNSVSRGVHVLESVLFDIENGLL